MKFQTLFFFAALLTSALVAADQDQVKQQFISNVLNEEALDVDPECFNKLKGELQAELQIAMNQFVDRIDENGMPVFKSGIHLQVIPYITQNILPRIQANVGAYCVQQVKGDLIRIAVNHFGKLLANLHMI